MKTDNPKIVWRRSYRRRQKSDQKTATFFQIVFWAPKNLFSLIFFGFAFRID
jgi:hypothetical protein